MANKRGRNLDVNISLCSAGWHASPLASLFIVWSGTCFSIRPPLSPSNYRRMACRPVMSTFVGIDPHAFCLTLTTWQTGRLHRDSWSLTVSLEFMGGCRVSNSSLKRKFVPTFSPSFSHQCANLTWQKCSSNVVAKGSTIFAGCSDMVCGHHRVKRHVRDEPSFDLYICPTKTMRHQHLCKCVTGPFST